MTTTEGRSGRLPQRGPAEKLTAKAVLQRNYLFRGLPGSTLERLASLATRRVYQKGAVIFSQGDPGDALFGVASGRVRISASGAGGREVFLNIMEPGDTFGEIAVMDGLPRTAGATPGHARARGHGAAHLAERSCAFSRRLAPDRESASRRVVESGLGRARPRQDRHRETRCAAPAGGGVFGSATSAIASAARTARRSRFRLRFASDQAQGRQYHVPRKKIQQH
jgi:hypothetical protein